VWLLLLRLSARRVRVLSVYGPTTSVVMASKDVCFLCDIPFYGKQKCIRCSVCELRFHCNCLKTNVSECNVDATTGKSSFMCDNCVIGKEQAIVKNNAVQCSGVLDQF
jgi:hypothetical protein